MFKKVQLKFFLMTTSILLAIFIAVLSSINIIMQAVMQRQSKVVLQQIASSVEYNEKTSSFTYHPEPDKNEKPPKEPVTTTSPATSESKEDPKDPQPSESTAEETVPTEPDTKKETSPPTENSGEESSEVTPEVPTDSTEAPETETAPPETYPPENPTTQPPTNPPTEQPTAPTEPATTYPGFYPPPYPGYDPHKPWDEEPPWWERQEDWEPDSENRYDYPRPEIWQAGPDTNTDADSVPPQEECTDNAENYEESDEIIQLAYTGGEILSGFTVMDSIIPAAASYIPSKMNNAPVPKSLGSIDFFIIMANAEGKFLDSLNNDELQTDVAQKYINAILDDGASSGMLNSYQFCRLEKDNGTLMVFTDKSNELEMLSKLTQTTVIIGVLSLILLSGFTFIFSKKSIEPIKTAFEKQKQFISDASHELKTPLTIISANADVLSAEIGENKWLEYIKSQAERMNVLVNDLLNLTRLENNTSKFIITEFDLSKAIENTALPFECQAFEAHKTFEIDIEENLRISGSEYHIKQMAAIFIDNALKYSNENGTVRITLKSHGDKKILSVFNTGQGVHEDEKDKIFERFYRSDDSRARTTGGYGLGLAIAKSIIDKHKFRITVDNTEGESICFNIIM
ncbi:MAG: ATP-binding protein [Ruminococcus sp.]